MAYNKVSSKLYQATVNGKYVDINCPYGKVQAVFSAFIGAGGMITEDGQVQTDIISLISNFQRVGDILLTEYGAKGDIISEGDCSILDTEETVELFEIAVDVVTGFIETITAMQARQEAKAAVVVQQKEKEAKAKKDKKTTT
jgi:hypothetical protein